ncbi:hypothetical protein ATS58_003064 [Salmonella enterica subsp. enterica serovar Pensacola]|nr:hypothetical protein [Salmonella enterica subsp. enterica serovar Pensacola]
MNTKYLAMLVYNWNSLEIQLNGTQNPNDADSAMYGTCNIEMDKSNYSHTLKTSDSGYDIHSYSFKEDTCNIKVDILDKKPQEARVSLSDDCQTYCGIQGNIHLLDGYYR